MICKNPYVGVGGTAFRCGRCIPCRVQVARTWKHRIMLEARCHSENCFVTLSYADEFIPVLTGKDTGEILGTLKPKDLQDWLKRLRGAMYPLKIRYYACGEYGNRTWRPHYHVCLFGFPSCLRGKTKQEAGTGRCVAWQCCKWCRLIFDTWEKGDVQLGELNNATAGYVSDYVIKKMTKPSDIKLRGRYPEFARMSLRPGIGGNAVSHIVKPLEPFKDSLVDAPVSLQHGSQRLPLGRYIRGKIREALGREKGCPNEVLLAYQETLRELRESARNSSEAPSFKDHLMAKYEGAVLDVTDQTAIYGSKKRAL